MFKLLIIPEKGNPKWLDLPHVARHGASIRAQHIIKEKRAKVVVIYRDDEPQQLMVFRPVTYVHIERISDKQ